MLANLSKPYFWNVFSSIWQTLSEIFIHKNLSQNHEISLSGSWNPHLPKGVRILIICFCFKDISSNAIPVQEKYITELWIIKSFILKSNIKIPWHPFQDKHLLSVMGALFTSQSQNPSQVFCIYECRSICASFWALKWCIARFRYFVKVARLWDQFCAMHLWTCCVTLTEQEIRIWGGIWK